MATTMDARQAARVYDGHGDMTDRLPVEVDTPRPAGWTVRRPAEDSEYVWVGTPHDGPQDTSRGRAYPRNAPRIELFPSARFRRAALPELREVLAELAEVERAYYAAGGWPSDVRRAASAALVEFWDRRPGGRPWDMATEQRDYRAGSMLVAARAIPRPSHTAAGIWTSL